ncbi:MAG: hypothetical protein ACKOXK_07995 [Chakrabartia sp.]
MRHAIGTGTFFFMAIAGGAMPAQAADLVDDLVTCRAKPAEAERLACYDARVATLSDEIARKNLVVIDRSAVAAARKDNFGLSGSDQKVLAQLNRDPAPEASLSAVEGRLRSVRQALDGSWVMTLEDGAVWAQTGGDLALSPRVGDAIRIRKAALGSFMANINGGSAIRVRRVK